MDIPDEGKKEEGTVVFLEDKKGYGFIEVVGRPKNIFFHAKDMRHVPFEKVRKGDTVEVHGIVETPKGFNALAVYLVS